MQASSSSSADAVDMFIVLIMCSRSCSGGFSAFVSVQAKPHSKPQAQQSQTTSKDIRMRPTGTLTASVLQGMRLQLGKGGTEVRGLHVPPGRGRRDDPVRLRSGDETFGRKCR